MEAEHELLLKCVDRLGSRLDRDEYNSLRNWWEEERGRWKALTETLLSGPEADWERIIIAHQAHRHPWYEQLAAEASLEEYARFFLENWAQPSFISMVERTLDVQICDEGQRAIRRNLQDEQAPVPHADLMRRLILALKQRAGDLELAPYASLLARTLVFHYGYFVDPWHLVGTLFATEVMAQHRMTQMKRGFERLGFDDYEIEYIKIHLTCDEHHAHDWREGVIYPSTRLSPQLRKPIAEGIAACLETSVTYLDEKQYAVCNRQFVS